MYNAEMGNVIKPLSRDEFEDLNEAFINGNFRRPSNTVDGGDKRP